MAEPLTTPGDNIIRGPDGEIIARPRTVLTGLVSHYGALVLAVRLYKEQLQRMADNCEKARDDQDEREDGSGDDSGATLLGQILALERPFG